MFFRQKSKDGKQSNIMGGLFVSGCTINQTNSANGHTMQQIVDKDGRVVQMKDGKVVRDDRR